MDASTSAGQTRIAFTMLTCGSSPRAQGRRPSLTDVTAADQPTSYREHGLTVCRRIRKRIAAARRQPPELPTKPDVR